MMMDSYTIKEVNVSIVKPIPVTLKQKYNDHEFYVFPDNPIWHSFWILLFLNKESFQEVFNNTHETDKTNDIDELPNAMCTYGNICGKDRYIYIALDKDVVNLYSKDICQLVSVISHEATHVVDEIINHIRYSNYDRELRAYMVDYFTSEILRVIKNEYDSKEKE